MLKLKVAPIGSSIEKVSSLEENPLKMVQQLQLQTEETEQSVRGAGSRKGERRTEGCCPPWEGSPSIHSSFIH